MRTDRLTTAMATADRFIQAAIALEKKGYDMRPAGVVYLAEYCKESAAVRRASMDLTRALAALRKGDR